MVIFQKQIEVKTNLDQGLVPSVGSIVTARVVVLLAVFNRFFEYCCVVVMSN